MAAGGAERYFTRWYKPGTAGPGGEGGGGRFWGVPWSVGDGCLWPVADVKGRPCEDFCVLQHSNRRVVLTGLAGGAGEGWILGGVGGGRLLPLHTWGASGGVFIFLEKEAAGSTPAETPGAGGVHDSRKVANLSLPTAFF